MTHASPRDMSRNITRSAPPTLSDTIPGATRGPVISSGINPMPRSVARSVVQPVTCTAAHPMANAMTLSVARFVARPTNQTVTLL
jgi:hypothetical protein